MFRCEFKDPRFFKKYVFEKIVPYQITDEEGIQRNLKAWLTMLRIRQNKDISDLKTATIQYNIIEKNV